MVEKRYRERLDIGKPAFSHIVANAKDAEILPVCTIDQGAQAVLDHV
jgi:hypothetical protein